MLGDFSFSSYYPAPKPVPHILHFIKIAISRQQFLYQVALLFVKKQTNKQNKFRNLTRAMLYQDIFRWNNPWSCWLDQFCCSLLVLEVSELEGSCCLMFGRLAGLTANPKGFLLVPHSLSVSTCVVWTSLLLVLLLHRRGNWARSHILACHKLCVQYNQKCSIGHWKSSCASHCIGDFDSRAGDMGYLLWREWNSLLSCTSATRKKKAPPPGRGGLSG